MEFDFEEMRSYVLAEIQMVDVHNNGTSSFCDWSDISTITCDCDKW